MTISDQPPPTTNDEPAVWDLVIADMRERDAVGRARYGTPLQPFNGRDALVDAYQESLDQCVYLRQLIYERDARVRQRAELCGRTDVVEGYARRCGLTRNHGGTHQDGVFTWRPSVNHLGGYDWSIDVEGQRK